MAVSKRIPGGGRKKGVTRKEMDDRLQVMVGLVVRGYGPAKIWDLLQSNRRYKEKGSSKYRPEFDWDLQRRQVAKWYKKALELVQAIDRPNIKQDLVLTLHKYDELYRLSVAANNYHAAARVLRDKAKLLGLDAFNMGAYEEAKKEHGIENEDEAKQSDDMSAQVRLPDGTVFEF